MSASSSQAPDAPGPGRTARTSRSSARQSHAEGGFDVTVAVDLVMLQRGLTWDQAHELLRGHAEESGRDLHQVASDVIDLGASRLPG